MLRDSCFSNWRVPFLYNFISPSKLCHKCSILSWVFSSGERWWGDTESLRQESKPADSHRYYMFSDGRRTHVEQQLSAVEAMFPLVVHSSMRQKDWKSKLSFMSLKWNSIVHFHLIFDYVYKLNTLKVSRKIESSQRYFPITTFCYFWAILHVCIT